MRYTEVEKGKIYYKKWKGENKTMCGLMRIIDGFEGDNLKNNCLLITGERFDIGSSMTNKEPELREATFDEIRWFEMCEQEGKYLPKDHILIKKIYNIFN